jgi:hypothetical protein
MVGRCKWIEFESRVESAWSQCLKQNVMHYFQLCFHLQLALLHHGGGGGGDDDASGDHPDAAASSSVLSASLPSSPSHSRSGYMGTGTRQCTLVRGACPVCKKPQAAGLLRSSTRTDHSLTHLRVEYSYRLADSTDDSTRTSVRALLTFMHNTHTVLASSALGSTSFKCLFSMTLLPGERHRRPAGGPHAQRLHQTTLPG